MKYNISNDKLKMIVEELGEEYKDMLIAKTLSNLNEVDTEEIVPSELIRIDVQVKKNLSLDKREFKRKRILTMISLLGIMYAMLGVFLLLFNEIESIGFNNTSDLIAISCIFIGLFLSIISIFMKILPARTLSDSSYSNTPRYEIVTKWKEIEAIIIQLTPEDKQSTLQSMINYLVDSNIIKENDSKIINEIRIYRNKLAHTTDIETTISSEKARKLLKEIDIIITKLEKIV